MVQKLKQHGLWNWRGLLLGVIQALLIAGIIYTITTVKTIAQNASDGRESLKRVVAVEQKNDSICKVIAKDRSDQGVFNARVENDVNWIKEALIRIENKLDK